MAPLSKPVPLIAVPLQLLPMLGLFSRLLESRMCASMCSRMFEAGFRYRPSRIVHVSVILPIFTVPQQSSNIKDRHRTDPGYHRLAAFLFPADFMHSDLDPLPTHNISKHAPQPLYKSSVSTSPSGVFPPSGHSFFYC